MAFLTLNYLQELSQMLQKCFDKVATGTFLHSMLKQKNSPTVFRRKFHLTHRTKMRAPSLRNKCEKTNVKKLNVK